MATRRNGKGNPKREAARDGVVVVPLTAADRRATEKLFGDKPPESSEWSHHAVLGFTGTGCEV